MVLSTFWKAKNYKNRLAFNCTRTNFRSGRLDSANSTCRGREGKSLYCISLKILLQKSKKTNKKKEALDNTSRIFITSKKVYPYLQCFKLASFRQVGFSDVLTHPLGRQEVHKHS